METARLGEINNLQIQAYRKLMAWVKADPDLEPWAPYLVAVNPDGFLIRVLVGYAAPFGYIIIGPNCSQTGSIHRVQDLRDNGKGIGPDDYMRW